jgi:hypothetical protein
MYCFDGRVNFVENELLIAFTFSAGFITGSTEHMFRTFSNNVPHPVNVKDAIERIQPLNLTPKQQEYSGKEGVLGACVNEVDLDQPINEELLQSGATVHEERRKLYGHGNECYTVGSTPNGELAFTAAKGLSRAFMSL